MGRRLQATRTQMRRWADKSVNDQGEIFDDFLLEIPTPVEFEEGEDDDEEVEEVPGVEDELPLALGRGELTRVLGGEHGDDEVVDRGQDGLGEGGKGEEDGEEGGRDEEEGEEDHQVVAEERGDGPAERRAAVDGGHRR